MTSIPVRSVRCICLLNAINIVELLYSNQTERLGKSVRKVWEQDGDDQTGSNNVVSMGDGVEWEAGLH